MGLDLGEMYATLGLDTKKFEKGIKETQNQTKNLGNTVDKDLTGATKDAERATENLADELSQATTALRNEGTAAQKTSIQMENVGTQTTKAKDVLGFFKNALSAIGVTVGLTQVIDAFKDMAANAADAKRKAEDMAVSLNAMTGATDGGLVQITDIARRVASELGDNINDVGTTVGKLSTFYGLEGDELEKFALEYQSFFDQVSKSGDSVQFDSINTAMKKWNITIDDNLKYLGLWYEIAQNTGVSMETMLSLLDEGDRAFQLLGLSAEQASNLIGNAYRNGDIADIPQLISAAESVATLKATELGSEQEAQKYLQTVVKQTTALKDEAAMTSLLSSEFEINQRIAGRISGALSSVTFQTDGLTSALEAERKALSDVNKEFATWEQNQTRLDNITADRTQNIGTATSNLWNYMDIGWKNRIIGLENIGIIAEELFSGKRLDEVEFNLNPYLKYDGTNFSITVVDDTKDGIQVKHDAAQSAANQVLNPTVRN